MKLIIDADIPRSFFSRLKESGYDVIDVRDIPNHPLEDEEIFRLACKEQRALITRDLDFSNILHYPPASSFGIIVLRAHLLPKEEMFKILKEALKRDKDAIRGTLIIATKDRLRFHK
jgi:predicted nuclease of predicted toxin-antitoxin system